MIAMIASKRFRLSEGQGFRWIDAGAEYKVADQRSVDFHEKTGRGIRKAKDEAKGAN